MATERIMQDMPDIWDEQEFYVSIGEIAGAVAGCAVRQSPYPYPEGLSEAMRQLYLVMPSGDIDGFYLTTYKSLRTMLFIAIMACPTIRAWNESKNGNTKMAIVTRDGPQQHQDDDFIDLDALARNAAQQVTVAVKYDTTDASPSPSPAQ